MAPGLHRGWEDRRFSCRRSRVTALEALGVTLTRRGAGASFCSCRPTETGSSGARPLSRVVRGEILDAFPALNRLVESLK